MNYSTTVAQKATFQRGSKYAEQVGEHTKSAISVMFCGSAARKLLPVYVVYRSGNMYPSWAEGGPKGTIYNSSAFGWFNMFIFEDWFTNVFLPAVGHLPGKKPLIGDKLASHIKFVCLPPNVTDEMQPLDVGFFFGLMKSAWKTQLKAYADRDPAAKLLLKMEFPKMLKELVNSLKPLQHPPNAFEKCGLFLVNCEKVLWRIPSTLESENIADRDPVAKLLLRQKFPKMLKELINSLKPLQHLPKAFEKCGFCPINCEKVLQRIPSTLKSETITRHLDSALLKKLEVRRFVDAIRKKPRGKKVPAGQRYTWWDSEEESSEEEKREESSEEEVVDGELEDNDKLEEDSSNDEVQKDDEDEELPDLDTRSRKSGSSVVAMYEGQWFVVEVVEDQTSVHA